MGFCLICACFIWSLMSTSEIFVLEKYWCLIFSTEILRKGQIGLNKVIKIATAVGMYLVCTFF